MTGAHHLDQIEAFIRRYVVFRDVHQSAAIALWIAHTHASEATYTTPYLHVCSPEKRCGKSRVLELLELLVARPWLTARPTEAVLYRTIEERQPTLILDEVDTLFGKDANQHEGVRAVLNAGHRNGATVSRCIGEGPKMTVRDFRVFCPKALAGIGKLPDTVADRSIRIELARKHQGETVERFRQRKAVDEAAPIRELLAGWIKQNLDSLRDAEPQIPESLNDRAADGWEPLLAIADLAGGDWPARARASAEHLSRGELTDEESLRILLLGHIRRAFEQSEAERLSTEKLLGRLVDEQEAPWGEWWGRQLDNGDMRAPAARLARLLKPYGIRPKDLRLDNGIKKGYQRSDFEETWQRYLPKPGVAAWETLQRDTAGQDTYPVDEHGWAIDPT